MSFWRFKQTSMTNRQSGNSGNDPDPEAERLRRSISEWPSERDVIQRFQQQQQEQQQQQVQGRGQSGQNQSTSDTTKRNSPPNKNQKTYPGFQVFKEQTNPKDGDELLEETRAEQELRKRQKEDEWYEMAREMDKLLHPKKAMKEPRLPEPKKFKSSGSNEHKDYERKRH